MNKRKIKDLFLICFTFMFSYSVLGQKADDILGFWISENAATGFEIYKSQNKYFSKIVWLAQPNVNGKPKLDKNNVDISKRDKPLLGTIILSGLVFDKDEWNDGTIYNAKDGKTYKVYLQLDGKNLNVIGFKGSRWLSKINTWYPVQDKSKFPERDE
ncbi:DUF2147 domain-containing protein [Winogradskyella endarachnes]|uniref:DUF2147 domain-containing protein n=1 Tax=Winogradskyella endarachnes TaxID=2681965 RepID=A0A6L6U8G8_9FLAO|nr:DUF2147 domain-containing protein [Winogradskyella endarachnes]MUU78640.1 DUF2147 domain-containing protein [Winogradskyella endarachnes]